MPPDDDERGHWLAFATQDLEVARLLAQHDRRAPACFHAQQCAEKALKAGLLGVSARVPQTHGVVTLLQACLPHYASLSGCEPDARLLDRFYTPMRYPDAAGGGPEDIEPGEAETEQAIEGAQRILDAVR